MKPVPAGAVAVITVLLMTLSAYAAFPQDAPRERRYQAAAAQNNNDWEMFRHDSAHTGFSLSGAPDSNRVFWATYFGSPLSSSPVTSADKVYFGTESGKFVCLKQNTGELVWNYATGGNITCAAAVMYGNVYFISEGGELYSLDAMTGQEKWRISNRGLAASPTVADGKIFACSVEKKVFAFNATTGTQAWNYSTGGAAKTSPAAAGGKIFFGCDDGFLYALDGSGKKVWAYDAKVPVRSSPAVKDNKVFVGAGSGLLAIDTSSGKLLWSNTTGGQILSSPALAYGKVFVGSDDMNVYSFSSGNGRLVWSRNTNGKVRSSPGVADGKVFVGSFDGKLYSFSANDSSKVWDYRTGGAVFSSPAVAGDKVFVGSIDGTLYCFGNGGESMSLACQPNPKRVMGGQAAKITVRALNSSSGAPLEGATVYLGSSLGGIFDPSYFGITNASGLFSTNFIAPNIDGITMISVNASHPRYTACHGYIDVNIDYRPMLAAQLSATPPVTDSGGTSLISVRVNQNATGTAASYVNLTATYGRIDAPFGITDETGNYTATYRAPITDRMVTDTIVARVEKTGYLPAVLYAVIETKPKLRLTLAANPSVIYEGSSSAFAVFVEDSSSKPVDGAGLYFDSDTGSVFPERGYTSSRGRFSGRLYAPAAANTTEIVLRANSTKKDYNPGDSLLPVDVVKRGAKLLRVDVFSGAENLANGGACTVAAAVRDAENLEPVTDAAVSFAVSGGAGRFSKIRNDGKGNYSADFSASIVAKNFTAVISAAAAKTGYRSGAGDAILRITTEGFMLVAWAVAEPRDIAFNQSSKITVYVRDQSQDKIGGAVVSANSKGAPSILSPNPLSESREGTYTCSFAPLGVTGQVTYDVEFAVSKAGFADTRASVSIAVSPPPARLPACEFVSPANGSVANGALNILGKSSAVSGTVKKVFIQISKNRLPDGTAWKPAAGTADWSFSVDTADFENGFYRIFARSFNGSAHSGYAYIDIWIENPQDDGMGFYIRVIAAGIAGSGTATILVAVWMWRGKPKTGSKKTDPSARHI
jgi:outer membrane protein assembly factor BamB